MAEALESAVSFLSHVENLNGRVLIHCLAGECGTPNLLHRTVLAVVLVVVLVFFMTSRVPSFLPLTLGAQACRAR